MCVWVTWCVKPSPRFSTWFGADRLCYGTGADESVGYGLWESLVDMSLPLLCGDWPAHVGSANVDRSGWAPRLSGQMNLNDRRGLLLASVLIADTLTGQKYRHLESYGRVCVDSHLILMSLVCFLHPLTQWFQVHPERHDVPATSLKAPHLSSLTSHWHCSLTVSLQ